MRNLILTAALAAIFGLVGCGGGSPPGGPGAKDKVAEKSKEKDKDRDVANSKDTFTFKAGSVSVEQGSEKEFTISVSPGSEFKEDITFSFEGTPKGVTFDPAAPKVEKGGKEVKVKAKAAADAPPTDDTKVTVKAASKGKDTTDTLTVTVKKKG